MLCRRFQSSSPSIIDSTKPSVGDSNPAQPPTIDSTKSSVGNSNPAQPSTIDSTKASVGNSNPPQPPIIDNIKPSVDDSKLAQPPSVSSVSSELRQTELLGGIHNTPFNDAIDIGGYPATQTIKGIVKIVLQFGDSIDGFEVSYKLDDSSVKRVHHGTTPPTQFKIKTRTITFESTEILAAVFGRWLNNSVNAIDEIGFIIFDTEKLTTRQEGPFSATNNNPKFYIPGPILAFAGYAKNGSEHRGLNSLSFLKSSTSLADVAVFDAIKPISPARPLHIYWFPDQVDCRTTGTLNTQQKGDEISLNWAAPITITTWIKYESFVDRCIFHTECNDVDPLGDDHELHYKMTSKNEFTVSTKSTPQMKLMSNPLPRSTWSFVVVVFQSPTVMLYLDDNEPKSGEWAGPKTTSREKTTVHVGYSDWGGYIRDFKVYQHALTQV
ncbi:hypothetical protein BGY98DRAFT_1104644 [Russula aff. rugulosa BPL654]|nr:hypothetical protein BGY98DRAFT_1104644 [Russula aff. rugulosa BPL654]